MPLDDEGNWTDDRNDIGVTEILRPWYDQLNPTQQSQWDNMTSPDNQAKFLSSSGFQGGIMPLTKEGGGDFYYVNGRAMERLPEGDYSWNPGVNEIYKNAFIGPDGHRYVTRAQSGAMSRAAAPDDWGHSVSDALSRGAGVMAAAGLGATLAAGVGAAAGAGAAADTSWANFIDVWDMTEGVGAASTGSAVAGTTVAEAGAIGAAETGAATVGSGAGVGAESAVVGSLEYSGIPSLGVVNTGAGLGESFFGPDSIIGKVINWANNHQFLASTATNVGAGLIKGAMAPTPEEQARAVYQAKLDAENRAKDAARERNRLGGVHLNRLRPTGATVRRPGIINNTLSR